MISYGGHMSWVSLDSLDFKYSVPSTELVSDHLSQFWFKNMVSIWQMYLHHYGIEGFLYPCTKALPCLPFPGRWSCFSELPLRSLYHLHSSTCMQVSCIGLWPSKGQGPPIFHLYAPSTTSEKKIEASFRDLLHDIVEIFLKSWGRACLN